MAKLWTALGTGRVRFARLRAIAWIALGIASFPLGWADSVVLVWLASVYANVESAATSAEAANDDAVLAELRALRGPPGRRQPCRSARPVQCQATRSSVRKPVPWMSRAPARRLTPQP